MGKRILLAAALMLLTNMALAGHAISLEPEALDPEALAPEPLAPEAAPEVEPTASVPEIQPAAPPPQQAVTVVPAPKFEVTFPAEHDVYLVPAATREVCTTLELGFGEIRTDCRMQPISVRAEDPALRGLCITRYGQRRCY